jgi:hypothetical protein
VITAIERLNEKLKKYEIVLSKSRRYSAPVSAELKPDCRQKCVVSFNVGFVVQDRKSSVCILQPWPTGLGTFFAVATGGCPET